MCGAAVGASITTGRLLETRPEGGGNMGTKWGDEAIVKGVLQAGTWGGKHIALEVNSRGGATVEYDCAHGKIGRRIVPDRSGRFDVPGTHTEESGGPVRQDAQPHTYAVRYTGRVRGGRMSLTVTRGGTGKVIGTYTLVRGQEPSLFKCR